MKKNNKKGFTLVELLAVIVILAILATAAFTLVIPRVNKARKEAFISEAASIIDAAELYFVENGDANCVSVNELFDKGFTSTKGSTDNYAGIVVKQVDTTAGSPTKGKTTFGIDFTNGVYTTNKTLIAAGLLTEESSYIVAFDKNQSAAAQVANSTCPTPIPSITES